MSAIVLSLNDGKLKRQLEMTAWNETRRKPCTHEKRELYTPFGWMCVECLDERRAMRRRFVKGAKRK